MPSQRPSPPIDVKEACVQAARSYIAEHGVDQLNMREVARLLGVSHQAPYKHFESKDHLVAEVMRRCFREFAQFLDAREHSTDAMKDLYHLGLQYQKYAQSHPVEYRLMFNTPWPSAAENADLVDDATHAFDALRSVLRRLYGKGPGSKAKIDSTSMFIWVNMHGLASVTGSPVVEHLGLGKAVEKNMASSVFGMIRAALDSDSSS